MRERRGQGTGKRTRTSVSAPAMSTIRPQTRMPALTKVGHCKVSSASGNLAEEWSPTSRRTAPSTTLLSSVLANMQTSLKTSSSPAKKAKMSSSQREADSTSAPLTSRSTALLNS